MYQITLSVPKIVNVSVLIKNTNSPITTRDESEIKGFRMMFLSAYLRMNMGKRRDLRVKSIENGIFCHSEARGIYISCYQFGQIVYKKSEKAREN